MPVLFIFIWLLNFAISAWNAYAVGRAWVETKVAGGWPRFMAWMGAIMSASGFSWCYLFLLVLGASVRLASRRFRERRVAARLCLAHPWDAVFGADDHA